MRIKFCIITAITLASLGCASIKHNKVTAKDDGDGIRYYNSSPYLLVYTNGKGGLVTQILFIADPEKKMAVTTTGFMANAQATMEFEKGVYKSGKNTVDATAVPQAIIKAIQAAGSEFLSAANALAASDPEMTVPAPQLYKIVVNGSNVSFVGKENTTRINVNLLVQEGSEAQKEGKKPSAEVNPKSN